MPDVSPNNLTYTQGSPFFDLEKTHCMLSPKGNRSDKSGPESRLRLGKSALMEWISIGV